MKKKPNEPLIQLLFFGLNRSIEQRFNAMNTNNRKMKEKLFQLSKFLSLLYCYHETFSLEFSIKFYFFFYKFGGRL